MIETVSKLIFSSTCDPLTAQKIKFSIKDFFHKCDQIRRFLRICSHLLKKFLMENFIFCAVQCMMKATLIVHTRLLSLILLGTHLPTPVG